MRHTLLTLLIAPIMAVPAAATAQPAAVATRVSASSDKAAENWSANPVGIYDVTLSTAERFTVGARVTVTNTGDKLSALFWPTGDYEGQKMEVAVAGTELILTAKTVRGPMEVSIERRGDKLSGKWTLGGQHGTLKGDVAP